MAHQFHIVDVFAEQLYTGNPLAVVICDMFPDTIVMQHIAAEINYSETTFVLNKPEPDGGYRMRIFTPAREIEFTGHPLLGTAWVVREYLHGGVGTAIQLNTPVGVVPVSFESGTYEKEVVWFTAPDMSLGEVVPLEPIADSLGLSPDDIDQRSPIQVVSAGTSAIIVPLRGLASLEQSSLNLEAFSVLAQQGFPPLLYLVSEETRDSGNDLCVRFFFEAHGPREDPATGNGAAFLGRYLLEHQQNKDKPVSVRIEQGHHVRRPSLVLLRAAMREGLADVRVGGAVLPAVQGTLCSV
jgi:trans-2,3-dihydro-3-hydroxyanthranilate isomerase